VSRALAAGGEGAGLAGQSDVAQSDIAPPLVVPQRLCDAAGEPQALDLDGGCQRLVLEGDERVAEGVGAGREAIREQARPPGDEEVGRPRVRRRWCVAHRPGHVDQQLSTAGCEGDGERLQVGLVGQHRVERFEASSRREQLGRHVGVVERDRRDQGSQPLGASGLVVIEGAGLGGADEAFGRCERTRLVLQLGRDQRPPSTERRLGRQVSGAFEERDSGPETATRPDSVRRSLELGCHELVRCERRLGTMPGQAIRVDGWIGRVSERLVDSAAGIRRGAAIAPVADRR
jgi:hypothetical protein